MFDADTTITIGLRTTAGKTDIPVRWPSDAEWVAHRKRSHVTFRNLGRGAGQHDSESREADAKLYDAIKLNGAPPLTQGESSFLVAQIARCVVLNVELRAADAEVTLDTPAGEAKHTVRIPNMDEIQVFQRSTKTISLPNNVLEARASLEASAALWDKCGGKVEGYDGPAPIIHKDVAIRAVIQAVENEAMPSYGEGNF